MVKGFKTDKYPLNLRELFVYFYSGIMRGVLSYILIAVYEEEAGESNQKQSQLQYSSL